MAHVSTVRHYKFYIELQPSNSEHYWYYVLWMYNLKENVRYFQWEEFVTILQIVMAQKHPALIFLRFSEILFLKKFQGFSSSFWGKKDQ